MTINLKQAISIALVVLGVLMVSSAQLTDIIGAGPTKMVVSFSAILNSILAGVLTVITSTTGTIKDVVAMANDPSSPVQGIVTTSTPEGRELAKSIEGPIVPAGSQAANDIASS